MPLALMIFDLGAGQLGPISKAADAKHGGGGSADLLLVLLAAPLAQHFSEDYFVIAVYGLTLFLYVSLHLLSLLRCTWVGAATY